MRQLTASEASNDEMERKRFEKWFNSDYNEDLRAKLIVSFAESVAWEAWQAALKSKQGEV